MFLPPIPRTPSVTVAEIVTWLSHIGEYPDALNQTEEVDSIEDDWMTSPPNPVTDPIIDTTPSMKRMNETLDDDETLIRIFDEAERDNLLGFIEQGPHEDDFFSEVLSLSKRPRLENTPSHKSFVSIRNTLPTEITSLNAFSIPVGIHTYVHN